VSSFRLGRLRRMGLLDIELQQADLSGENLVIYNDKGRMHVLLAGLH